jgi:uncharacterized protein
MSVLALSETSFSSPTRGKAAAGAMIISAIAALGMALFSTSEAIDGSIAERSAIPLRMLLLFGAATLFLRFSGSSWRAVGLRAPSGNWRTALLVIGGYLAVGVAFAIVGALILPALGLSPRTTDTFAGLTGNTGLYLYLLIVVAWGSAAFGEELVFRGFLQSTLELAFGPSRASAALAVLAQAIVFGALHLYQGAGGAVLAGTTGLIIGLVYLAGGRNLWACILLHGLIDTVSISAIYFGFASA